MLPLLPGELGAACASGAHPRPGCCMLTSVCLVSPLQPVARGGGRGGSGGGAAAGAWPVLREGPEASATAASMCGLSQTAHFSGLPSLEMPNYF